MFKFDVQNLDKFSAFVKGENKRMASKMRYVLNGALYDTTQETKRALLPGKIDRPTPWLTRGVFYKGFGKANSLKQLDRDKGARIDFNNYRQYIARSVVRGSTDRADKSKDGRILIPTKLIRRNRYGNVPRLDTLVKRLQQKGYRGKPVFEATIKGLEGLWVRSAKNSGSVKLLVLYAKKRVFPPLWPTFYQDMRNIFTRTAQSKWLRTPGKTVPSGKAR